jgi:xanthine dehydrogenase small subunit
MRTHIVFFINGREQRVGGPQVFTTLSQYLRYDLGATGTKIVCEEGDCGACTVLVGRVENGDFVYRAVNSCIQALAQLDGTSVITVEGLRVAGALNGVQESMVASHGAQCGYCTPGFIVAMTALFESSDRVDEQQVRKGLTGNLCRCTGYEPIIKAALAVDGTAMPKIGELYPAAPMLAALPSDGALIDTGDRLFCAPVSLEEALTIRRDFSPCTIVQGGTDVGVWVNKRAYSAPALLSLAHIAALDAIEVTPEAVTVGANVTLSRFETALRDMRGRGADNPGVAELLDILELFGSPQIRNAGTLAGNIANASPIADTLPYLFIAGARLELTGSSGKRTVPIDTFYRGYKQLDLAHDELITRVIVPLIPAGETVKLYKVSRRKDLDISAFTAGIRLRLSGERIDEATIAYGGVGPVVMRLPRTEAFLAGKPLAAETFEEAGRIARGEVAPITDVRGSAGYRSQLAENILQKFWYETFGTAVVA